MVYAVKYMRIRAISYTCLYIIDVDILGYSGRGKKLSKKEGGEGGGGSTGKNANI